MAKRYKKALYKSRDECKRLKKELSMEESSSAARWNVIKVQSEEIKTLTMERNGKQSLLMNSLSANIDIKSELKTYKLAALSSLAISMVLLVLLAIIYIGVMYECNR